MIQVINPEVKRGSPTLSSNRRPCSLECGCVKQRLGRKEVCHEYFACRGQSGVWRGCAGTSQDTEHTDTVTGLSALLLGHRIVSTADTGGAAHRCPGEYGHMICTWPNGVFYLPWNRDWLRTGALTSRDPGPVLILESREEELWFGRGGAG